MAAEPQFITPDWPAPAGVHAAFTLRTGGVSEAPYNSLNIGAGIGDSPEAVKVNRNIVRSHLRLPGEPVWLEQVHGIDVVNLEDAARVEMAGAAAPPRADASVAGRSGRVCVIRVADCLPVMFAAVDGSVVGAAHAGWHGLSAGVLESTVRELGVRPAQLIAWMGPAIGPSHFEVGEEVRAAFLGKDAGATAAFALNDRGRWQCDLYALARRRLEALGMGGVYGGGWCTYADAEQFFSYRRDGQCGRMAALIWIESERHGE